MPSHRFPPDATNNRTICFKGRYLSIVNQQTGDEKTHEDNAIATTEFEEYEIPAGYTCYVIGATVYFKV
jgi:tRNA U34 2-thiouridine synthase MnmA/TrmU